MQYIRPSCYDRFYCPGEGCAAPCPAPVDRTWTRTLGDLCEMGLDLGCPRAAALLLLGQDKLTFIPSRDDQPPAALSGLTREQLSLLLDARRTMDLLLQDREMALRPRVVLALTYAAELEPLLPAKRRYAYDELDWGFTEQPTRQFQVLAQLTGQWDAKRTDLLALLADMEDFCGGDRVLAVRLRETKTLFSDLSGGEYQRLRDRFDREMAPRDYLFENLLVCWVHRYFLDGAEELTVVPFLRRMGAGFALLRAMCFQVWRESGSLTDQMFIALCWHLSRQTGQDPETAAAFDRRLAEAPCCRAERLQRLLWQ